MLGRRRRYDINDKHERFYSALNSILQGTAAELMKLKIREMYRQRKRLGLTMRSTVHDEENSTKPKGVEGRLEIARFMDEQLIPMRVPILWETGFGPNWEETKKLEAA
jgi:DNA polymerase I-like protein with 3'-5' exonuclease and polymerase domains